MIRRDEWIPGKREGVFFDIETTGFSPKTEQIYLMGVLIPEDDGGRLIQWFAENAADESALLQAILPYFREDQPIISFNGDSFDLPFIRERCIAWGMTDHPDSITSLDLYKIIRPYKALFGLADLKQKTVEKALNIGRDDTYSGGELIKVYLSWQLTRSPALLDLLFLHNRDDVAGLAALDPIRTVPEYFRQKPLLLSESNEETGDIRTVRLEAEVTQPALLPWKAEGSQWKVSGEGTSISIELEVRRENLKYFFPNYRDYEYFPEEDRAIHKSVAKFSERKVRQKATAETCYQNVSGWYFPLNGAKEPTFRTSYKDKQRKIDLAAGVMNQPERWDEMVKAFHKKSGQP